MSPEQAVGDEVDARADLYALGVVFYRMLTAQVPFGGDNAIGIMYRHVNEVPQPPGELNPDIPQALEAIVMKLLAKEPGQRFQSGEALCAALDELAKPVTETTAKESTDSGLSGRQPDEPSTMELASATHSPAIPPQKSRTLWFALGGFMTLILILTGIWHSVAVPESQPSEPTDQASFDPSPPVDTMDTPNSHPGPDELVLTDLEFANSPPLTYGGPLPHSLGTPYSARYQNPLPVSANEQPAELVGPMCRFEPPKTVNPVDDTSQRTEDQAKTRAQTVMTRRNRHRERQIKRQIDKVRFVKIPEGQFKMGSRVGLHKDTWNVHVVEISAFWLAQTEVTQELWETVMGKNPACQKGTNQPVTNVSWTEVQAFLKRLNRITRGSYRLPTEAEWEYACKAGGSGRSGDLHNIAWYVRNAQGKPQQVGIKQLNDWQLADMRGNVWEWCQDYYDPKYYKSSPARDPGGPEQGETRIIRGGSYDSNPPQCRCSWRSHHPPEETNCSIGFRIARDLK